MHASIYRRMSGCSGQSAIILRQYTSLASCLEMVYNMSCEMTVPTSVSVGAILERNIF